MNLTTSGEIYVYEMLKLNQAKERDILMFFAILEVLVWGRILLMMQLTRTLGPMMRIILSMFGEISKFLLILLAVLI